jgi:hypothetical protein
VKQSLGTSGDGAVQHPLVSVGSVDAVSGSSVVRGGYYEQRTPGPRFKDVGIRGLCR